MKTLILDIETSPNLAWVWGLRNQFLTIDKLEQHSEMLSWAAKWRGSNETYFGSSFHNGKQDMIEGIHEMLEEADTVVTFNGERFDLPILNQEFLFAGMNPPKPYMSVDLYRTVSRRFRTPSNKLAYWLERLGLEGKADTGGFELWKNCMLGDKEAWATMMQYNTDDVIRTEQLMEKILPWIPNFPVEVVADAVDQEGKPVVKCSCGSCRIQRRGYKRTASGLHYRQYACMDCGRWFRERTHDKDVAKSPLVHAGQI